MAIFTAPDGTEYEFDGTPTQNDIDSIVSYHNSLGGGNKQAPVEQVPVGQVQEPESNGLMKSVVGGLAAGVDAVSDAFVGVPLQGLSMLSSLASGKDLGTAVETGQNIGQHTAPARLLSQLSKQFGWGIEDWLSDNPAYQSALVLFEKVAEMADEVGGKVLESTGSPELAAEAKTMAELGMYAAAGGAAHKVGGVKAPKKPTPEEYLAEQQKVYKKNMEPERAAEAVEAPKTQEAPLPSLENAMASEGLIPGYEAPRPVETPLPQLNDVAVEAPLLSKARKYKETIPEEKFEPFFLEDTVESAPAGAVKESKGLPFKREKVVPEIKDYVPEEQGLPFTTEGKRAATVELMEQSKDVQSIRRELEADKARLQQLESDLINKTEIGVEQRLAIQDAIRDIETSMVKKEQTIAEVSQAAREMSQLKVQPQGQAPKTPTRVGDPLLEAFISKKKKGQSGQIHLDLLTWPVSKLLERAPDFKDRRVLSKFIGTFSKDSLTRLAAEHRDPNSRSKLVWMSPRDFLTYAKDRSSTIKDPRVLRDLGEEKREPIRQALLTEQGLAKGQPVPRLYIEKGEIIGHEGRHRMDVFIENGLDLVPVEVRDTMRRNKEGPQPYNSIITENGKEVPVKWKEMDLSGPSASEINAKQVLGKSQRGSWTPFESSRDKSAKIGKMLAAPEKLKYMLDPEKIKYEDALPDLKEFIEKRKAEGKPYDIKPGNTRNNVMSGGQMMSQFFKNDLMTWGIGVIKTHAEQSRIAIRDIESKISKLAETVSKVQGKESLHKVMEVFAHGEDPSVLTGSAKALHDGIRAELDKTYQFLNEEFKLETGKDLHKKDGYFPHSWFGPWGFEVKTLNEAGKEVLIDVVRERNKASAEKARKYFEGKPGDYIIGDVKYNKGFEQSRTIEDSGFIQESMDQMLAKSVENSPKALEAQQAFRDHFKLQTGVGGYLGAKPWRTRGENMSDAMDSFNAYIAAGHQWVNGRKAQREINKFIEDKSIDAPEAKNLLQQYYNNSFKRNKNQLELVENITEQFAKSIGRSSTGTREFVRNNKAFMTMLTLAHNGRFLVTQVLQPIQTVIPKMLEISAMTEVGANHGMNLTLGMLDTMAAGKLTKEGKELLQYARDNHIINPQVIEHMEGFSNMSKGMYLTEQGLSILNKWAEKATRFWAFSSLYRTARDVGLPHEKALNMAKNQVQTTMVSYEVADRPLMYGKLGIVGESASNLRTFSHNNYTALVDYAKTAAKEGKWGPFVSMFSAQLGLAGALGLWGIQELDALWGQIKQIDNMMFGGKYTKDMPSINEALINSNSPIMSFGGLSAITGHDMGTSFSAGGIIPASPMEALFPLASKEWDIISTGVTALKSWDSVEDWGVFLDKTLPASGRGFVAEHFLTKTLPDGRKIKVKASKDPSRRIAEVENPDKNFYRAKAFGTLPLDVSAKNRLMYEDVKSEASLRDLQESLTNKIIKEVVKDNMDLESVQNSVTKFVEAGGDINKLEREIEKVFKNRGTADPRAQLITEGQSDSAAMRNKRILDRFRNVPNNR